MSAAAATATTLTVHQNRFPKPNPAHHASFFFLRLANAPPKNNGPSSSSARNPFPRPSYLLYRGVWVAVQSGSRADDSAPYEMSVEGALKLLGVSETSSFDEILRAKNSIIAACKDDKDAVAQLEAAHDMLLMRSLNQGQAGKVASSSIRYADVKPVGKSGIGSIPQCYYPA